MADTPDAVDQIEYRWHDTLDLSPVASTMPRESRAEWNSWIRDWVRHPHVERLFESLCYQVHPDGRAALAWRYEDWQAAERDDGSPGRPLFSRVLVGQASLLTPEVAIALCRTGLPAAAGPRPGQVKSGTQLPVVEADELNALVSAQTDKLDEEAARQEGLPQVLAAAMYDPRPPLAIHIRDTYILKPPAEGLQGPMLWGLRRIIWPILGDSGRGWSFSTFEPPLGGDVDPATLPAILFRQTQDAPSLPPARPRTEIKCRPFDPVALEDARPIAQMARWLVDEYQERGGDELGQLTAEWCGTERVWQQRCRRVFDALYARHAPLPPVPAPAPRARERRQGQPQAPARSDMFAPSEPSPPAPAGPTPAVAADQVGSGLRTPALTEGGAIPPYGAHRQPVTAPEEQDHDWRAEAARFAPGEASHPGRAPVWSAERDRPTKPAGIVPRDPPRAGDEGQSDHAGQPAADGPGDTAEYRDDSPDSPAPEHPAAGGPGVDPRYHRDLPHPDALPRPDESVWHATHDPTASAHRETARAARSDASLGQGRLPGKAPELYLGSHAARATPERGRPSQVPPAAMSDLLRQLPNAADTQEFKCILRDLIDRPVAPDFNDRVKARREVSKEDWYERVCGRFGGTFHPELLAAIFRIIVIRDLDNPDVTKKIAEWAERAHPDVIGSLLEAAQNSGEGAWHSMMQILQPKLAYRWMIDHQMQALWHPSLGAQHASDSGRRFNLFKRNDR